MNWAKVSLSDCFSSLRTFLQQSSNMGIQHHWRNRIHNNNLPLKFPSYENLISANIHKKGRYNFNCRTSFKRHLTALTGLLRALLLIWGPYPYSSYPHCQIRGWFKHGPHSLKRRPFSPLSYFQYRYCDELIFGLVRGLFLK